MVRGPVVGDVPAEHLTLHVGAAIVQAGPDARLEDLGEWLGERVERPRRPSGTHEVLVIWNGPPTGSSPKNIRSTATCAPSRPVGPRARRGTAR